MRECDCVPGHRCDCWDFRPADDATWDAAAEDIHRAFCEPDHEKVGPWDRDMAAALRRRGLVIRRADAEPRLREALRELIEHHRDGTQCDTRERWWPESCEVADRAARAALTTPDTTGEDR